MRTGGGCCLHGANLHRRSVGAQQQAIARGLALLAGDEQRVLRVARGMVRRKVERLEVVVVGLDLGTFADGVAHRLEDGDDLVHHAQHGMLDADGALDAGEGDVEALGGELGIDRGGVNFVVRVFDAQLRRGLFSSLTRRPTSRFAGPGAAFSQVSLTWVSTPFLRASQRSRKALPVGFAVQIAALGVERGEEFGDGAVERFGRIIVEFGDGVHASAWLKPRLFVLPLKRGSDY